jgi:hypothetical protein
MGSGQNRHRLVPYKVSSRRGLLGCPSVAAGLHSADLPVWQYISGLVWDCTSGAVASGFHRPCGIRCAAVALRADGAHVCGLVLAIGARRLGQHWPASRFVRLLMVGGSSGGVS